MAATLYPSRNDVTTSGIVHTNAFPRSLMTELDFHDTRYPSLTNSRSQFSKQTDKSVRGPEMGERNGSRGADGGLTSGWEKPAPSQRIPSDMQSTKSGTQSHTAPSQEPARSAVSYTFPPGNPRRVVERYSLDERQQPSDDDTKLTLADLDVNRNTSGTPQPLRQNPSHELLSASMLPSSSPRHPALGSTSSPSPSNFPPPIMPLSASPGYNPPISSRHRAYAQQPTYVAQSPTQNPVNPVFAPAQPPQEEVCIECAMRDQDMADVDVTSPGVWERESDVLFEELKQREAEEEATGIINSDDPPRPKSKGGRLSEQNLKMWLTVNPREPTSRQQTLNNYLKSQRTLLEAEALAYARAMQEAKQLDNRMRDAYSQLRRSAYDMGSSAAPADDTGGVRIKPPASPSAPAHVHERSHSRDVTLLENGMIVEHVDVRKEEREERERRRKEEKRVRKLSRSSATMDGTSFISAQSLNPQTDGLRPYSRYSQTLSSRPMSVLTAPLDRPDMTRAQSQASFSDVHSLGSGSPRRSVFFPARFWKDGFSSRDSLAPSGMSGSMVDMHVALHRENQYAANHSLQQTPIDLSAPRSQMWGLTADELALTESRQSRLSGDKSKKKKKGLAKIWQLVTRSSKHTNSEYEDTQPSDRRLDDDMPLAPPPPLSYLVNRGPGVASTPSLPSTASQKLALSTSGMSPPTACSSVPTTPASSRPSGPDAEASPEKRLHDNEDDRDNETTIGRTQASGFKNVHSVISEPDIRLRATQQQRSTLPNVTNLSPAHPVHMSRDKSLPPLPGESQSRPFPASAEARPRTMYTYDPRQPAGTSPTHDFLPPQAPFRNADAARRQSFGGLISRPTLDSLMGGNNHADPRMSFGPRYDDFGGSRRSLNMRAAMTTPSKRKSRFSFASLLGKKAPPEKEFMRDSVAQQAFRNSGSETQDDAQTLGYATSNSRHSAFSASPGPRMSVTSRKALEELVSQDAEFVAYRYPSNDQSLDLLR